MSHQQGTGTSIGKNISIGGVGPGGHGIVQGMGSGGGGGNPNAMQSSAGLGSSMINKLPRSTTPTAMQASSGAGISSGEEMAASSREMSALIELERAVMGFYDAIAQAATGATQSGEGEDDIGRVKECQSLVNQKLDEVLHDYRKYEQIQIAELAMLLQRNHNQNDSLLDKTNEEIDKMVEKRTSLHSHFHQQAQNHSILYPVNMSSRPEPSMLWGQGSDTSLLRRAPHMMRIVSRGAKYVPFVLPLVVGGAWLVYPGLTPAFKASIGIGPAVEKA